MRAYLVKQGVVAPATTREELIVLANAYASSASSLGHHATASVNSAASQASATVSDSISSAYHAATDAPRLTYDYAATKMDDARDYVWSTWVRSPNLS